MIFKVYGLDTEIWMNCRYNFRDTDRALYDRTSPRGRFNIAFRRPSSYQNLWAGRSLEEHSFTVRNISGNGTDTSRKTQPQDQQAKYKTQTSRNIRKGVASQVFSVFEASSCHFSQFSYQSNPQTSPFPRETRNTTT